MIAFLETLFPKVRAELITLLFPDSDREYHLRELARLSGLAVGTIQREVRKLEEAGLIESRRDGNRIAFRANNNHPLFPELKGLAIKSSGLKEKLQEALVGLAKAKLIFIFGSTASGEAKPESDVDLMVIGDVGLRELAPRLRPVSNAIGREINPHALSLQSFKERSRTGDAFICNVIKSPKIWLKGSEDELAGVA